MKNYAISILIFLFWQNYTYAQSVTTSDTTLLTEFVQNEPKIYWNLIKGSKVYNTDSFKGTPPQLDHTSIYELKLQQDPTNVLSKDSSSLYILSGLSKDKKIVIADINGDRDFSNDVTYTYSVLKSSRQTAVDSTKILKIPYLYKYNNRTVNRFINIRILPFEPIRLSATSREELMEIYVDVHATKRAFLPVGAKIYEFRLLHPQDLEARYENSTIEILDPNTNESLFKDPTLRPGEEVKLDRYGVSIDRVSAFGDSVFVKLRANMVVKGVRPDNTLPDKLSELLKSQIITTKQLDSSYILIDFWGSWCGPCIRSIPNLKSIYSDFKENPKFKMISVAYELHTNDRSKMERIINDTEMSWDHIAEFKNEKNKRSLINEFGIESFPTTILIDKNRNIINREIGTEGVEKLHESLKILLK